MTAIQPTRKDIAEFFRLGLLAGVCDLPSIVRWADGIIASEASPPFAFLDLSTCESQPVSAAVDLLTGVPGERTPDLAVQMLLGHCSRLARSGALHVTDALLRLYRMATAENFPHSIYSELVWQEDAFALARDRVYGSLPEVEQSFVEYLSTFASYAPQHSTAP
jgi:hypothetical protein